MSTVTGNLLINGVQVPFTGTIPDAPPVVVTPPVVTPPATKARPAGNTGTGFFVAGGSMYDPGGNLFTIRGVNRNHYDSGLSPPGIVKSGANTCRIFVETAYGQTPAGLAAICANDHIAHKQFTVAVGTVVRGTAAAGPIVGIDGSILPADLAAITATWVAQASVWAPVLNPAGCLNIGDEWGPGGDGGAVWAAAYLAAIPQLRAAGYTCPIMIDCEAYSQEEDGVTNHGAAILAADPQKNILFGYHLYGSTSAIACPIASISPSGTILLQSTSLTHPFSYQALPPWNGSAPIDPWNGISKVSLNGQGITVNPNCYGQPGAWALQAPAAVAATFKPGDILYDYNHYSLRIARLAALCKAGVMVGIYEFGPGNNWGPSPTLVTPAELIASAEANGVGWLAWAWDDHNQADGTSTNWFNLTVGGPGLYTGLPAELSPFGAVVVGQLQALAKPAVVF
jgi:hypothetical protein